MPWYFWLLVLLCLALTAALGWALSGLYGRRLQSDAVPAPGRFAEGWEKLDQLLSMLISLQDHGVSHPGGLSREEFSSAVLDSACRLMRCSRGSIMVWDETQGVLRILAAQGPWKGKEQKLFFKPGEGVAGRAFQTGQPVLVKEPLRDSRYVQGEPPDAEPFISIPLLVKSKPIGVLNLHETGEHEPFSDYNVKFLNILAGEAAGILHNLDLFERLETFYLEMVKTLARVVDSKDHYTHEHSDRASTRARRLAAELQLPSHMTRYIEYAALLHDIGKIGIDEAILLKPGKLTSEEYEQMKKHPIIGHQILAPVQFLGPVAQMVLYHQEWYDGRGYPEGLKGEQIPLGARVVAVIDAWDAMTSDRPYRKALGRDIAIAELKKGAGTQFDPKIVSAFLKIEKDEWDKAHAGQAPVH
ncbi:MAG: GAF domain-containing protein [Elusimicrobia bacterium]|nr:GAF domain-containing protein [Elusimicrobiota bacterium]